MEGLEQNVWENIRLMENGLYFFKLANNWRYCPTSSPELVRETTSRREIPNSISGYHEGEKEEDKFFIMVDNRKIRIPYEAVESFKRLGGLQEKIKQLYA